MSAKGFLCLHCGDALKTLELHLVRLPESGRGVCTCCGLRFDGEYAYIVRLR